MRYIPALLIAALVLFSVNAGLHVQAAPFGPRSLLLSDSKISATATHEFTIEFNNPAALGSLELEYCTDPFVGTACTAPAGLDVSAVTLSNQTGETGFTIDGSSTGNRLLLTRTPAAPASTPITGSYQFDDVTNPSVSGTQYVRISSFSSTDGTGPRLEEGGVAFSIVEGFSVTAYIPPFLDFCVGVSIGGAGCSAVTGNALNMGNFDSSSSSSTASQFRVATNGSGGYSVSMLGQTMTSGTNVIPQLATPQSSNPGVSQFGVNLRNNVNPNIGADVSGAGTGVPTANYNLPNQFLFNSGDVIASSSLSTEYNTFTLSYMVNISDSQPVGVYATTLTFVALASF